MTSSGRVLVLEKKASERAAIVQCLISDGFVAYGADNADHALAYLSERIDVVLCDLHLEGITLVKLLGLWRAQNPLTRYIILGSYNAISEVVEAIKAGADDYLAKPIECRDVLRVTRQAMEEWRQEIEASRAGGDGRAASHFIGQSPQIREVFNRIARAGPVDSTVMILGENGTGKELVAHALHEVSPRIKGRFVAVNVAAVPAGLVESELFGHVRGAFTGATERRIGRFEQASGGTLFIDEIGDFDLSLQPKLLRVLETHTVTPVGGHDDLKVDVRVVVATSRNIEQMVRDSTFREDLYYRLNVVQINVPPLRDRAADIPLLVNFFVNEISARRRSRDWRLSPELMRRLVGYRWPGNVRQLHNVLESMMVLADGDQLTEKDLPQCIAESTHNLPAEAIALAGATMDELERGAIVKALGECSNNRTRAAAHLGISVRTMQRKLRLYELERLADVAKKTG